MCSSASSSATKHGGNIAPGPDLTQSGRDGGAAVRYTTMLTAEANLSTAATHRETVGPGSAATTVVVAHCGSGDRHVFAVAMGVRKMIARAVVLHEIVAHVVFVLRSWSRKR